jgi:16S rRNA (uracil1498-N3)-methyltransferase
MHLFFEQHIEPPRHQLNDENCKHALQVLRMKVHEKILITNGNGEMYTCFIQSIDKKNCIVEITDTITHQTKPSIHLAIAFTKNPSRIEWMLEKITEIGIVEITPLITKRSEKTFFKKDRFTKIILSAMCQSQQAFLPLLNEPKTLEEVIKNCSEKNKFIAHCIVDEQKHFLKKQNEATIVLIGPEGDFTEEEISTCLEHNFVTVTLGNTRLRTETAGLVAVTLLNN